MASAVTVIFGANSTQFQAELARMQTMAGAAGRRISGGMAGGHGGHAGQTGIVRESAVIGREIAMGRGMGRILASMTLLAQYMNTAKRNAGQGISSAAMLADAYEKMAVKARLAAVAALKKAEATAVAAEMDGFEDAASIAAADAAAVEAKTADAAAVALERKAVAAWEAAEADEAAAAAAVTAGGAFRALLGTLGFFALLLVIIVELYVVVKSLTEILNRTANAQKRAAEWANEHKLALWEEMEAMEKLKNASEDFTQALVKMNREKDRSVELAREAIEAFKAESDAKEKLYDAGVKGKLLDIEIAHKKGLITEKEAIQQKAAIETQAVTDKAAAKQAALDGEARIADVAAFNAARDKEVAQKAAQAADDKINNSPEGKKRVEMLLEAEKDLQASKLAAEQAKKDEIEFNKGGSNILYSSSLKARLEGYGGIKDKAGALKETTESTTNAAASAEIRVNSLKRLMKPDEIAAANAKQFAEEKTGSALSLKEEARKTATAAAINRKNSPAEIAAEKSDIEKKKALDLLPGAAEAKGYGNLNSQQRLGAYAATPPILLEQLHELRGIRHNTTPIHFPTNHPPGEKKPQLAAKPSSHPVMGGGSFGGRGHGGSW